MHGGHRQQATPVCDSQELGLFHEDLLIVQVIGHGHDEKQDDQGATHGHDLLPVGGPLCGVLRGLGEIAAQQRKSKERQAHPGKIER